MAKPVPKTCLILDAAPAARAGAIALAFAPIAAKMGLAWRAVPRAYDEATPDEAATAQRIVWVGPSEFRPLVESRFPGVTERIEAWPASRSAEDGANALVASILGGGWLEAAPAVPPPPPVPPKRGTAKVGRETAGRRGKGVTVAWELGLKETELQELAAKLKAKCGTGGTAKDGRIEIQGDHRDRVAAELEALGWKVKRAGG
ncbi:MAG: translation initiation factor [Gemmataceae bacterium]|nr:translation initiation factor [Gemmataceae bacterium]